MATPMTRMFVATICRNIDDGVLEMAAAPTSVGTGLLQGCGPTLNLCK